MGKLTHKLTYHPLYTKWAGMKDRCNNYKHKFFKDYGGRGIKVCDEWNNDFKSFYNWCMDSSWEPKMDLDRINNNDGYYPENCRFVSRKANTRNRRNNTILDLDGDKKTLAEWAEITGIISQTIMTRIKRYGWTVKQALSMPSRGWSKRF